MTPQLERWLAFDDHNVSNEKRSATVTHLPTEWHVRLDDRGTVAAGHGSTLDAAELAALEAYAEKVFVPGVREHGRRVLGLPKRRRAS